MDRLTRTKLERLAGRIEASGSLPDELSAVLRTGLEHTDLESGSPWAAMVTPPLAPSWRDGLTGDVEIG
jgi:hypothetical protein